MINLGEGAAIGGVVLCFASLVFRVSKNGDSKRKTIYDRIEQERKDVEVKYQPIKMCDERYKNLDGKVEEVKGDIKKLLGHHHIT